MEAGTLAALMVAQNSSGEAIKAMIEKNRHSNGFFSIIDPNSLDHYFESGAIFRTFDPNGSTLTAASPMHRYEITNGVSSIRMFREYFSTLSNKYSVRIHEMPPRDLSAEPGATILPVAVPNRVNIKEFPVHIYDIDPTSDLMYSETEIEELGEVVDHKLYILESSSPTPKGDGGTASGEKSIVRMDNENHNYLICLENLDGEDREFFINLTCGVPEYLEY